MGSIEISLKNYKEQLEFCFKNIKDVKKVNLLGGEPLLHPNLEQILEVNRDYGLKTTIYTNGTKLKILENFNLEKVKVRVGILGLLKGEKTLEEVPKVCFPFDICYMLRKNNVEELFPCMDYAQRHHDINEFMVSNIVDYSKTLQVWGQTVGTLSKEEYLDVYEKLKEYASDQMAVSISRRGIISDSETVYNCRFANILPNKKIIICPFDVSIDKESEIGDFGRKCKWKECCFQKKYM